MARGGLSGVIDPTGEMDSRVSNTGNEQTTSIHKNIYGPFRFVFFFFVARPTSVGLGVRCLDMPDFVSFKWQKSRIEGFLMRKSF